MPFDLSTRNVILGWAFGKSNLYMGANSKVYIGLSSTKPEGDGGVFTELTGDTYARVLIAQYGQTYPDIMGEASGSKIKNANQINWAKANAEWAPVNGFGLFTDKTDGTPYYYANLDLTEEQEAAGGVIVTAGAVMLFDPESLEVSFGTTDVSTAAATTSL